LAAADLIAGRRDESFETCDPDQHRVAVCLQTPRRPQIRMPASLDLAQSKIGPFSQKLGDGRAGFSPGQF